MFNPASLRTNFAMGLILCSVAVLLLGAGRVNHQLRDREQAVARATRQARVWHTQLATELPEAQQAEWLEQGQRVPLALLRACSIETIPTR